MKEKLHSFQFEDFLSLFEQITKCKLNIENNQILFKRLLRFFDKYKIEGSYRLKTNFLIRTNTKIYNDFLKIFIPDESFFFREKEYLKLASKFIDDKKDKKTNLLSLPCSWGEEIYSLKMINNNENTIYTGLDILPEAIEKAKSGIFTETKLKQLPETYLKRYFQKFNNLYKIKDELKKSTYFSTENIMTLSKKNQYDIILCRNLLIYLNKESREHALQNIFNALKKGGILITAKCELSLVPKLFERVEKDNLIFFKRLR